jgi:hypothetical protein
MDTSHSSDDINRYELGMQILARLRAEAGLPDERDGRSDLLPPHPQKRALSYPYQSIPERTPSLVNILAELAPLPDHSVLIGSCEDSLPVILDLTDPASGSLLLMGDPECGKTSLIKSILASACAINSPAAFQFGCITSHNTGLEELADFPHCCHLSAPYERKAADFIAELVYLTEQRSYGKNLGGPVILAIDDLSLSTQKFDDDTLKLLSWLIKNGASSQIWTIAGVSTSQFQRLPRTLVTSFKTLMVGAIDPDRSGRFLPPDVLSTAASLIPGAQFAALIEQSWIRFWIPVI